MRSSESEPTLHVLGGISRDLGLADVHARDQQDSESLSVAMTFAGSAIRSSYLLVERGQIEEVCAAWRELEQAHPDGVQMGNAMLKSHHY